MTTTPGLEWLTIGATVAYIHGDYVRTATVDKIGKRDVVVTVSGRTEKFNITRTQERGDSTWLRNAGGSAWSMSTELAPLDDPIVAEKRDKERREKSGNEVRRWASEFQINRDVETARTLRDAIDTFLALHGSEKDSDHA